MVRIIFVADLATDDHSLGAGSGRQAERDHNAQEKAKKCGREPITNNNRSDSNGWDWGESQSLIGCKLRSLKTSSHQIKFRLERQ
jgi:hypothetical protein